MFATFISLALAVSAQLAASPSEGVRCARNPALSPDGTLLCFTYLGDLWSVSAQGGRAVRLTAHPAHDRNPRWSPDGTRIAFESNRTGDYNLFVIPADGGPATQITYHSSDESLFDWLDDNRLIFAAGRDTRMSQLYAVDIRTLRSRRLTNDTDAIRTAAWFPGEGRFLFVRGPQRWWRPKYRGAADGDLYLLSPDGRSATRLTDDDGFDDWPMATPDGKTIYWVSSRGAKTEAGETNLWRMNADGTGARQVTNFQTDFVTWPSLSRNGRRIAFEHDADLYVLDLPDGKPKKLNIIAPSDDTYDARVAETRSSGVTSFTLTPDASRAAFVIAGEVFWVDAKRGGQAKRVTENPANDQQPALSPDGKRIAFISNRKLDPTDYGNYHVYVADLDSGETRQVTRGEERHYDPIFSPDGRWLAFRRGVGGRYLVVVPADGGPERIVAEDIYLADITWSPDSKWLAYSADDIQASRNVFLVPFDPGRSGKPVPLDVTKHFGWNGRPTFSPDGKNLLFLSGRAGAAQLFRLPLEPEPDPEDKPHEEPKKDEEMKPAESPTSLEIDEYLIEERAKQLTSLPAGVSDFAITADGRSVIFQSSDGHASDLWIVPMDGGDSRRITTGNEQPSALTFPSKSDRLWFLGPGGSIRKIGAGGGTSEALKFSAYITYDRRAQLYEMFDEAWATLGAEFYDPDMHGLDWKAIREKYRPLTSYVATKEDFYDTWARILGELKASHTGMYATDRNVRATGALGVEFDEAYDGPGARVLRVIKRSPAENPNSRLYPGDVILSIEGKQITYNEQMWEPLADTVGRRITLRVRGASGEDRTVLIRPTGDLGQLLYDEWVDENAKKVEEWSNGRVAYLHIQGMGQESFQKMQRWMFGPWCQGKDALIIDVRYNGGGWLHDDIYALLARRQHAWEKGRGGPKRTMPFQMWGKPTLMMINQFSGSDAEIVPSGFRYLGFGKVLGMPTYGGVIGTYDIRLVDGTTGFRLPVAGWWDMDGRNLENYGVPPDIFVDNSFEDAMSGYDRQLHEAVKELLKQTAK